MRGCVRIAKWTSDLSIGAYLCISVHVYVYTCVRCITNKCVCMCEQVGMFVAVEFIRKNYRRVMMN